MRLAVNIDHVATLREARGGMEPDPVHAAVLAELAGASGIVCHLREDRRHVNDRDVRVLRDMITTKLDLEMAATPEIIAIALEIVPDLVTIVPEKREELTTEGGLAIAGNEEYLADVTKAFHERGILVSFFIEPEPLQIDAAVLCGVDIIELHTGTYANARSSAGIRIQLERIRAASMYAAEAELIVTAGHGLDLRNIEAICAIPEIEEVSIGHALVSRALLVGFEQAVREYVAAVS
ncbi:MAG: pyridoxine 5'-phosphate synthase [Candidatus Kapabacteria bacterium]|nr:pyridoxine 5'-phosphate synthase [Candidatus Kapabacteria bacterium]